MNNNTLSRQAGFAHVVLIVFLVVAAGIGSIAYVVYGHQQTGQSNDSQTISQAQAKPAILPVAPEINSKSDLDKTLNTLNRVDPSADSQGDSDAIDSLAKDM